jgi:hypothetical protein
LGTRRMSHAVRRKYKFSNLLPRFNNHGLPASTAPTALVVQI